MSWCATSTPELKRGFMPPISWHVTATAVRSARRSASRCRATRSCPHSVTIYFRADCSRALRGRNLGVIYVNNPQVRGFFRLEKSGLGGFFVVFTAGDIHSPAARRVAG